MLLLASLAGCDRVFGLHSVSLVDGAVDAPPDVAIDAAAGYPAFVRSDHTNYADGVKRPAVTASISEVDEGDLMVVAVCSSNDKPISMVSDDNGTVYMPTTLAMTSHLEANLYYARITAKAATFNIHVTFEGVIQNPDIRLAEYRNLTPQAPLTTSAVVENGTTLTTGPLDVTATPSLVIAATCVGNYTTSIEGYTQRVFTSPNGDVLSDLLAAQPGSYSAVTTTTAGAIIVNLVAFTGSLAN
jgi:hypothetical protein